MKTLNYLDKVKLWRLMLEIMDDEKPRSEVSKLNIEALKIYHGNDAEIDQWSINNAKELNVVIDELNKYYICLIKAQEQILEAGKKLNTDFSSSEDIARKAIELASGDPEEYRKAEQEIQRYFASDEAKSIITQKKKGIKVDHPPEIIKKQQFIQDAKNMVNTIANRLMVENDEFRENRVNFIKTQLQKESVQFENREGQLQYRAVRPFGEYGRPNTVFEEGLSPQFVSIWAFQEGVISKPYINDVATTTGEKVGWTGGIASTSSNLKFCAAFDFAASFGAQDGYIYVYSCNEAASVGKHISIENGYDGKVDKASRTERSNASAAMEYMVPFLEPKRIIESEK